MDKKFSKASEIVAKIFDGPIDQRISGARSVFAIWNEAAGEKISAHSRIIDVKNGNLLVSVDHPGWGFQILFKKKEIIRQVNAALPEWGVKNIAFSVGR